MPNFLNTLLSSDLSATVLGMAAIAVATISAFYANKLRTRTARLAALASQRWPVIDLALSLIESEVDDVVNEFAGGRYLPVYEVAKQLFTEENFSADDVLRMADLAAREFKITKYEKFLKTNPTITASQRKVGESVANSVLGAVKADVNALEGVA